jgi:hypothetical protein
VIVKTRLAWYIEHSVSKSSGVLQKEMIKVWKSAIITSFKVLGYFCLEKELGKSRASVPRLKISDPRSVPGTSRISNMNVKIWTMTLIIW